MALESKKNNPSIEKLNLTTSSKTSTPDLGNLSPATPNISEIGSNAIEESRAKPKVSRLSRATPARHSGTLKLMTGASTDVQSDSTEGETSTALQAYQPSKVFLSKCRSEHQALLDSIKQNYHDEIKQLYQDELATDLHILIGDQPLRPLHKCIIASRAYKFYSSLKVFKNFQTEPDCVTVPELSTINADNLDETIIDLEGPQPDESQSTQSDKSPEELLRESRLRRGCELVTVKVPADLIRQDLALNLVYRAYLNTDLTEEETRLNQELINWVKVNRPQAIRKQANYSPDHKKSFRTIQPDFEELTLEETPRTMADEPKLFSGSEADSEVIENEEVSHQTSLKDESFTGSSLPRTETFELISKHAGGEGVAASKNLIEIDDDQSKPKDANALDAQESEGSEPYAPTTRTGLKPKTFTTPVGLRGSSRGSKTKIQTKSTTPKQTSTRDNGSIKTASRVDQAKNLERQTSSGSSSTVASQSTTTSKRSSISATINQPPVQKNVAPSTKTIASPATKAKTTVLTRAHPISMERSQSPGTTLVKKNFVAANKQRISAISADKKPLAQSEISAPNPDEEELSALVHEPVVSGNIVAQLDKFALVSISKLADSLTKIFVDSILPDTIVLVRDGKQIEAHRSILATRSAYLNEIITKQSLVVDTSASTTVRQPLQLELTEYSYPVVYFSLLHLYSGVVKVPEDIDVVELTKLSNQLHSSTLNQVCIHHLRMQFCHYFHKPCNICSLGVLKTLPLAWRYDYTDLYSKCLQWIGSHFTSIFCLKEFSELQPSDLIEECYSATLAQLTPENIIPKTIECQKLLKNLPRVRWTEPIICLVGRLLEDFCHFVADNYEKILKSESFINLGKTCWECEILEENLLAAMNHLKPDSGCKTLIQLNQIECSNESYCNESRNVSDTFMNLVSKMRKYCERYLLKDAAAVVHCNSWRHMNSALQKRIKDQAILSTDFDEPTKTLTPKPKLPSVARGQQYGSKRDASKSPISSDGVRTPTDRSTPESRLKSPSTTYLPPPKNKPAAARHVKVLK